MLKAIQRTRKTTIVMARNAAQRRTGTPSTSRPSRAFHACSMTDSLGSVLARGRLGPLGVGVEGRLQRALDARVIGMEGQADACVTFILLEKTVVTYTS